ncbi:hypothetical protein OG601_46115 [Streptomyces sp. NBC_01239]|uniref:hypothetical protein n=1 Tax=Streptomyces sp. NBC_01239 TaxID=2903792 RepID=UPI00224E32B9|nr:hypothetical protein [Streptomyces sp. NBC_01239]MCX4817964.1 hypothetical protein [Streptomyces sp. NBC_01239]
MPHSARSHKHRTASAIGVLVAVIGMTVGGGVTASAATDTAKKCYIEVQVHGKWTKYEVPCG